MHIHSNYKSIYFEMQVTKHPWEKPYNCELCKFPINTLQTLFTIWNKAVYHTAYIKFLNLFNIINTVWFLFLPQDSWRAPKGQKGQIFIFNAESSKYIYASLYYFIQQLRFPLLNSIHLSFINFVLINIKNIYQW